MKRLSVIFLAIMLTVISCHSSKKSTKGKQEFEDISTLINDYYLIEEVPGLESEENTYTFVLDCEKGSYESIDLQCKEWSIRLKLAGNTYIANIDLKKYNQLMRSTVQLDFLYNDDKESVIIEDIKIKETIIRP